MTPPLGEISSSLAAKAAKEIDRRLIWDMVKAYADGTPLEDMAVSIWPDGAVSLSTKAQIGEYPEFLGSPHKAEFDYSDERRIQMTVR